MGLGHEARYGRFCERNVQGSLVDLSARDLLGHRHQFRQLGIGYDLQLTALANPSAGGFVTVAAVPIPGSLPLLLNGLLAGAVFLRRTHERNA